MTRIQNDKIDFEQQSSTPNSPSSGEMGLYIKDDGVLYKIAPDGTITPFSNKTEDEIEDIVAGLSQGGDKLSYTYDSGAGTLTIDTTAFDEAEIEAFIAAGNAVDTTYDSGAGTLTIAVDESAISHDSTTGGTDSDAHHSRYTDSEAVGATDGIIDSVDADTVDGHHASEFEGAAADVESVDGYDLSVVAALPSPADADTIYFVEAA